MTRSPWMAPPPPSHEDDRSGDQLVGSTAPPANTAAGYPEPPWSNSSDSLSADSTVAQGDSHTAPAIGTPEFLPAVAAALPSQLAPPPAALSHVRPRLSTSMIVALTVAIVVPPALLVGAILGYIAAR